MANTYTTPAVVRLDGPNTARVSRTVVTLGANYTTGGYAVTPEDLGLGRVDFAVCKALGAASDNVAADASYDPSTGNILLWSVGSSSAKTQVANNTNITGITVEVLAFGA